MAFLLQQGWGMLTLDLEFIRQDFAEGVIMSPRVYTPKQLEKHATDVRRLGGDVLFDPQFYQPHTEREKLLTFPYWDGLDFNTKTFGLSAATGFCQRVLEYQVEVLNVSQCIIPGRYTNSVSKEWLETQHAFAEAAGNLRLEVPIYSTLALGPDVITDQAALYDLLDEISGYPVNGLYVVFVPPRARFFVRDDSFLYNLLDGLLSIRLQQKDVILGYANQQSIVFAAAGVGRIASGNFRNTRHFNPEIFDEQEENILQRGRWYYHPPSLSDFSVNSLRLAFRRGLRDLFRPACGYCRNLVEAPDPGTVRWPESDAFRHFLFELGRQWNHVTTDRTPRQMVDRIRAMLQEAETRLEALRAQAFVLGDRAFDQCIHSTLGAFEAFLADRETDLARLWSDED